MTRIARQAADPVHPSSNDGVVTGRNLLRSYSIRTPSGASFWRIGRPAYAALGSVPSDDRSDAVRERGND